MHHLCALNYALQEKNIKHSGNISFSDIIEIARIMRPRSVAKNLAGTCKEMLGTAVSVGCTVDHMSPSEVIDKVSTKLGARPGAVWWWGAQQ